MYARQNGMVRESAVTNVIVISGYSLKSHRYSRRQPESASVRSSDVYTQPQAVGPPEPRGPGPGQARSQARTSGGRFPRAHGSVRPQTRL